MAGEHDQAEITEFEQALRTLAPAAARMDRDRLMFLAGRASARVEASAHAGRNSTLSEPLTHGTARSLSATPDGVELRPMQRRSAARWLWPAATLLSTSCAVIFGVLLVLRAGDPAGVGELAGNASRPPANGANEPQPTASAARAQVDRPVDAGPRTAAPRRPAIRRPVDRQLAFGFASETPDPDRLPVYLRMRQLVLEQGVEALPVPSPRSAESIADAQSVRSPTLRAIDRPGRTETVDGDLFDAAFPADGAGRL